MFQIKPMPLAVILQYVIKRSKRHSWSFISTCPNDIILSSKIRRKHLSSLFLNSQNIMNDLQGSLIGTDVIHGEDGSDFLDPGSKIVGNTTINSFLNVGSDFVDCQISGFEGWKCLAFLDVEMAEFMLFLMEKGVEFFTCDVVFDVQVLQNLFYLQRSCYKNPLSFFAVLDDLWFQWCVVHEHVRTGEVTVEVEDCIQFVGLFSLQLTAPVGKTGEWQVVLFYLIQGLQGGWDWGISTNQDSVYVCDQDRIVGLEVEFFEVFDQ